MRRNIVPPQFILSPTPNQRHKAVLLADTKTIVLLHVLTLLKFDCVSYDLYMVYTSHLQLVKFGGKVGCQITFFYSLFNHILHYFLFYSF